MIHQLNQNKDQYKTQSTTSQEGSTLTADSLLVNTPSDTPTNTVILISTPTKRSITPTPSSTPSRTPTPPEATKSPTPIPFAIVVVDYANIREGPGVMYAVIGYAKRGDKLILLGRDQDANWLFVTLPNGEDGWIFSGLVASPHNFNSLPEKITPPMLTPEPTNEPYGGIIPIPPPLDGISPLSQPHPSKFILSISLAGLLLAWIMAVKLKELAIHDRDFQKRSTGWVLRMISMIR